MVRRTSDLPLFAIFEIEHIAADQVSSITNKSSSFRFQKFTKTLKIYIVSRKFANIFLLFKRTIAKKNI